MKIEKTHPRQRSNRTKTRLIDQRSNLTSVHANNADNDDRSGWRSLRCITLFVVMYGPVSARGPSFVTPVMYGGRPDAKPRTNGTRIITVKNYIFDVIFQAWTRVCVCVRLFPFYLFSSPAVELIYSHPNLGDWSRFSIVFVCMYTFIIFEKYL